MTAPALDFAVSTGTGARHAAVAHARLIAGVIGAVLLFVGLFVNPFQFYRSYLWSYMFCVGLGLGIAGVADAAIPDRRRVGRRDPAARGSGGANAAAAGADVPADR